VGLLDRLERRVNDKTTENCVRLYIAIHLASLKNYGTPIGSRTMPRPGPYRLR
jgi:hypothetical protein